VIVLFFLIASSMQSTTFGHTKSSKSRRVELAKKFIDVWESGDVEHLLSLMVDNVVRNDPMGVVKGKAEEERIFKGLHHAFSPLYVNVKGCSERSDGGVSCIYELHGKFSNDFMGHKASNKWFLVEGASVYYFNEAGLLEKSNDYWDLPELDAQLKGKTPHREEILQIWEDWWNDKAPLSYIKAHLSPNYKIDNPFGEFDIDAFDRYLSEWRKGANIDTDFTCNPSEGDFDLWICDFERTFNVHGRNPAGFKPGTRFDAPGVLSFRFGEDNKIVESEGFFHFSKFQQILKSQQ